MKKIIVTMVVAMATVISSNATLINLSPHADIDIRSADLADNGYNRDTLLVGNGGTDPSTTRSYKAYVRYKLPALAPGESIVGATFTIIRSNMGAWNWTYEVSGMDDGIANETDWVEANGAGGTTWNNAPANITTSAYQFSDSSVVGTFQVANTANGGFAGDSHSVTGTNLLNFINDDSNGYVTLMIGRIGASSSSDQFASRTHSIYAAPSLELEIEYTPVPPLPDDALRTYSYNIHLGVGEDGVFDLNRTADVIAASNPDLVALQEVDKYTSIGNVDQAKVLGELLGMEYRFIKNMDSRGGEYGDAVLSRYPIQATYYHHLPPNGGEVRGALEVVVEVPDVYGRTNTLSFVSTHLDHLSNETRMLQVQAILDALAPRNHPIVLAGDFNAIPTEPIALLESNGYVPLDPLKTLTFPSDFPDRKLDYIMVKALPITESRFEVVAETMASDHRPVFAGIAIGAPADWLEPYGLSQEASSNFLDSDGDGMDNYSEWLTGTDPTNALSFFGFQSSGSGSVPTGFQLQWNSIAGRTYRIESSTNLVDGIFQPLESGIQGLEGTTEFIDTNATGEQAFYRVHVE